MKLKKTLVKIFVTLLALCMLGTGIILFIGIKRYTKIEDQMPIFAGINDMSIDRMAKTTDLDKIKKQTKKETGKKAIIKYVDDKKTTPKSIEGSISEKDIKDDQDAYLVLMGLKNVFHIKSHDYVLMDEWQNSESVTTYTFAQLFNGTRVNNASFDVSVKNEQVIKIEGRYIESKADMKIPNGISDKDACAVIDEDGERVYKAEKLAILDPSAPRYVWRLLTKKNTDPTNKTTMHTIYVNGTTKEIEKKDAGETKNLTITVKKEGE